MSNFFNRIALLVVFAISVNCTQEVIRVHSPANDKDKKNHGVVAFGLYAYNANHKDLLNLFSKDSGRVFEDLGNYGVKFSEIVSKNAANTFVLNPYPTEGPVPAEKTGSIQYLESKTGYLSPFYLLLSVDPKKEYLISTITYSYQVSCGQNCQKVVVREFPIEPAKSYKAFPIKVKAGEITFGGVLMGKVVPTKKDDPYGIPDDTAGITEIFSGNKVSLTLEPGDDFIKSMESNDLKKMYYGDNSIDKKGAEKQFYQTLIQSYPNGHWKAQAEKKLQALK
ncbi:plasminogen-binding receptor Lp30 [Leptospira haakeii]|uniref:Lipoprotein n=1 Tax=Leptospira haakeii TaxID=2023198 RepID=A0ABX4PNY3_9LEPT|nr:hypothetical protein [Leptospira haakeii]PKA16093.1 hypothetical protein CH363_11350 [Leptospira haakeii]PKA19120.1 hypothetical protein CH377_13735 [Leptospira haakeii]